ncbi:hypothetical protein BDV12DRAFT_188359 [Aspergillus spectabilis]
MREKKHSNQAHIPVNRGPGDLVTDGGIPARKEIRLCTKLNVYFCKRKRARKACIPCHQRKRKCDTEYPCDTCTSFEYTCMYTDNSASSTSGLRISKHVILDGGSSIAHGIENGATVKPRTLGRQPHIQANHPTHAQGADSASSSTTKSPATVGSGIGTGIFDEQTSRYTGASAAMAFPHILGVALGSDSPPKVNSFAYNFGIRPEEEASSHAHGFLGNLISEDEVAFYSNVYFSAMGDIGDFMDPRIHAQRCRDYYHQHTLGSSGSGSSSSAVSAAFAAVAAGVAAFGSFLSPPSTRSPREPELVQYAKTILDDPVSTRLPSIDHIIAWGMRVFYLRATTRPSSAWVASCTLMHICEIVGLHEDENIIRMAAGAGAAVLGHDADRLRRIFWISWAGHTMLSYEYDRSAVRFGAVTTKGIIPVQASVADQFVALVQIIPSANSPLQLGGPTSSQSQPLSPRDEDLFSRLKALGTHHYTHPFLLITKADLAFCFYRRIYQLKNGIPDSIVDLVIEAGNDAVEAALQLATQGRLLWNVIGSVFQYACVLLAIDTPASATNIPAAFKRLEGLVRAADTGLTRQALSIARHLLSLNIKRKRREIGLLEGVEAGYAAFPAAGETNAGATVALPDIGMGWGVDWDQFLIDQFLIDPYLSMLAPDIQL